MIYFLCGVGVGILVCSAAILVLMWSEGRRIERESKAIEDLCNG